MVEAGKKETVNKFMKQILLGIAMILILFGLFYLIDNLSNLFNFSISYYLWTFFQLILALLIIFIGIRVYSVGKHLDSAINIKFRNLRLSQILALVTGSLILTSLVMSPLSAASLGQMFQHTHAPIQLNYYLNYQWNYATGASVTIATRFVFGHIGVQILFDVTKIGIFKTQGWIMTPYQIYDPPGILHALMLGPATGTLKLGRIDNGVYTLKIVTQDATDVFSVHKTDNEFWIEESRVIRGSLEQKSQFDRSLDEYTLGYIGFPNINNETKSYVTSKLTEVGAVFGNTTEYSDGWSVDINFKYSGDTAKLSKIILEVAKRQPDYMVDITSSTGWRALTWIYKFAVDIVPQHADAARRIIVKMGLTILSEGIWGNYTQINISSAAIEKIRYDVRPELVQAFLDAGWKQYDDFYVSY